MTDKLPDYCRLVCNIHPKWQIVEREEEAKNVRPS